MIWIPALHLCWAIHSDMCVIQWICHWQRSHEYKCKRYRNWTIHCKLLRSSIAKTLHPIQDSIRPGLGFYSTLFVTTKVLAVVTEDGTVCERRRLAPIWEGYGSRLIQNCKRWIVGQFNSGILIRQRWAPELVLSIWWVSTERDSKKVHTGWHAWPKYQVSDHAFHIHGCFCTSNFKLIALCTFRTNIHSSQSREKLQRRLKILWRYIYPFHFQRHYCRLPKRPRRLQSANMLKIRTKQIRKNVKKLAIIATKD